MKIHKTIAALGLLWSVGAGCSLIGLADAVNDARVEPPVEICDNALDDDDDESFDCDDSDCDADVFCQPEICDNRQDDNGDGLTDCDDPDCAQFAPFCFCFDGIDNEIDGNEFSDCRDPICENILTKTGEICEGDCTDGNDGNRDGEVDCFDPQCAIHPHCLIGAPCDDVNDCLALGLVDPGSDQFAETVDCIGSPGYCTVTCNGDKKPFCVIESDGGQSEEVCIEHLPSVGGNDVCLQSCQADEDCRFESCVEIPDLDTGLTVTVCLPDLD